MRICTHCSIAMTLIEVEYASKYPVAHRSSAFQVPWRLGAMSLFAFLICLSSCIPLTITPNSS